MGHYQIATQLVVNFCQNQWDYGNMKNTEQAGYYANIPLEMQVQVHRQKLGDDFIKRNNQVSISS